jgi:hypothetical protein
MVVDTVSLTSIFFRVGFSALRAGVAFLPLALAISAGVASKLLARTSPHNIAVAGLTLAATGAARLSTASDAAHFARDLMPGLLVLGLGGGQ